MMTEFEDDFDNDTDDDAFTPEEQKAFDAQRAGVEPQRQAAAAGDGQLGKEAADAEKAASEAAAAAEAAKNAEQGSKFVPHQALHEERERRKALEAENAQLRDKFTRVDARLETINQIIGSDPKPEPQKQLPPNPQEDIFAAVEYLLKQNGELRDQLNGTNQHIQQQTAETQQRNAEQQLVQDYQSEARNFMAKEPTFADAYKHLVNVRGQELQQMGVTDTREISAIIAREEMQIVAASQKAGKSAVETIFNLSKIRGFTPKAAPDPNTDNKSDAEKQLEAIERAKAASQTLSGSGSASYEGLTAEKLINMDEDEFHSVYSKLSEATRRKMLGG